jgi:hypothetical protein
LLFVAPSRLDKDRVHVRDLWGPDVLFSRHTYTSVNSERDSMW